MPDDRLFHKRAGHSEKVNSLTDFEELVWRYYIESADDFGVLRFEAVALQADHDRLARRPAKATQKALERLVGVGLIHTFIHQGRLYCFQSDWQEWQKIDYPRSTIHPAPPLDSLSPKTQELFAKHPGGWGRKVPQKTGDGSANVRQTSADGSPTPSGESTCEPLAVSREPLARAVSREPVEPPAQGDFQKRAGLFCEWYAETHFELMGVGYIGNPQRDYQKALELCRQFTDDELHDATFVWFGQTDKFATDGTRTIPKFASRASDLVLRARKVTA